MREINPLVLLLGLVMVCGCDEPRPRLDPDDPSDDLGAGLDGGDGPDDQGGGGRATDLGPATDAADAADATGGPGLFADAADPDRRDGGFDPRDAATHLDDGGDLPGQDAEPAGFDSTPPSPADSSPSDAASGDAAPADATVLPARAFVTGEASTAEPGGAVAVSAADQQAVSEGGVFRLGPLAPGRVTLRFSAPGHQTESLTVQVPPEGDLNLADPVVLYRGRRITEATPDALRFRFDEGWLAWDGAAVLTATPLPAIDPRTLVAHDYEVFLGWSVDGEHAFVRRRTVPGLAGDLDRVRLTDARTTPLFVEAQPWVLELGERDVAMVHTRDALSRLESVVPGQPPLALAEGVPWLLVQRMADDGLAWAAAAPNGGFDVFLGTSAGDPPTRVSDPAAPASDAWLTTTPGRRGLLWLGGRRRAVALRAPERRGAAGRGRAGRSPPRLPERRPRLLLARRRRGHRVALPVRRRGGRVAAGEQRRRVLDAPVRRGLRGAATRPLDLERQLRAGRRGHPAWRGGALRDQRRRGRRGRRPRGLALDRGRRGRDAG